MPRGPGRITSYNVCYTKLLRTFSAGFGDYNRDGRLDLTVSHWGVPLSAQPRHLWRNVGNGTFAVADGGAGLGPIGNIVLDLTFASNFVV